jgi:hypothetical protein
MIGPTDLINPSPAPQNFPGISDLISEMASFCTAQVYNVLQA